MGCSVTRHNARLSISGKKHGRGKNESYMMVICFVFRKDAREERKGSSLYRCNQNSD